MCTEIFWSCKECPKTRDIITECQEHIDDVLQTQKSFDYRECAKYRELYKIVHGEQNMENRHGCACAKRHARKEALKPFSMYPETLQKLDDSWKTQPPEVKTRH